MNKDSTNLIIAMTLSMAIIFAWQFFYERPRIAAYNNQLEQKNLAKRQEQDTKIKLDQIDKAQSSAPTKLIEVNNGLVNGSINPQGIKFVNLKLLKYREQINDNSPNIEIFNDSKDDKYYGEFGWVSSDPSFHIPNSQTLWNVDNWSLSKDNPVKFNWVSDQNVQFEVMVFIDEQYMFKVTQKVTNLSDKIYSIYPYGLINRSFAPKTSNIAVIFEGLVGYFNDSLNEKTYEAIAKETNKNFAKSQQGWFGIADKYWLSCMIPDPKIKFSSTFSAGKNEVIGKPSFQTDYLGEQIILTPNDNIEINTNLFVGPRQATLLDYYSKKLDIKSFDKAVDFGIFYFITKPMYLVLNYFYGFVHNYGLAILLLTLFIKILMFPLASKSFSSINKMKLIQPKIEEIKKLYGDDKIRFNNELMQIYKKYNINPLSGCLPLFVQIPVFFSLYKVIFVAIEMRQAPFYGWIKDLSMPDPTSVFNLFGLLPFDVSFLPCIGAWAIIMGITMFIQQKLSPAPADPVQAQVLKFVPFMFIFLFYSFPSGLMIYWSASNILSISQQLILMKRNDGQKLL